MNKLTSLLFTAAVAGLLLTGAAVAQSSNNNGPGVVDPGHPRVNQVDRREGRQQKRIGNGIQNGTLTSKQASHLQTREAALQNRQSADMAKHNGHFTKPEQRGLNRQENRISRSIHRDKEKNEQK